ncbi:MAG: DUF2460 domain-containing protein [Sphingobacteriia bacterium]|nr:DUF2460 domain-containing protein [Sphingobacteriia bacterium]
MKNDLNNRFPEDISFGAIGGPEFATNIVTMQNGKEQRNIVWESARCKYNLSYGIKSKEDAIKVLNFFRAKKGKAIPFRFKDHIDYIATNQLIGIGNGITTSFQLIKRYKIGENEEVRVITKPVHNTVKIFLNDKLETDNIIDYEKGLISFKTPPKKGISIFADFEFDVLVRFDNDKLNITLHSDNHLIIDDIHLIEIK